MGCWFNCHRTTHQAPSTTHHYEHIKQEIIHKAEGEFGVNAKVDVDVLVDFMLQVQIDMGLDIGIQISVFKNEVFGIIGLIAFCVAIVLIAYFLRKCGCCCVSTTDDQHEYFEPRCSRY
ncbi:Oidioi.mRNA.OKI2018_I69.chr2.g7801.t1.cds [Oikopleura dioica]|uniref:Oidioi.mRNA.OKI2018_I69.chr2.g7801.t1.cds n=1 Tax=Oikopleura dioica TaxID=34765 RepID=A0ABN7TFY1_OIKDI|nr:Oidioi.mRNA.OKI2018_I69.chr2.g7801.t1.cds [Oikopleura dioica]